MEGGKLRLYPSPGRPRDAPSEGEQPASSAAAGGSGGPGAAAGRRGGRVELTSRNLFHCPTSLSYWEMVVSHCLSSRKLPLSGLPPAAAAASAGLHQAAAHTHTKAAALSIWARGDTGRRGVTHARAEPRPGATGGGPGQPPAAGPFAQPRKGRGVRKRGRVRVEEGEAALPGPARHLAASPATALLRRGRKGGPLPPHTRRRLQAGRPARPSAAPRRAAPPAPSPRPARLRPSPPLPRRSARRHRRRRAGANGLRARRGNGRATLVAPLTAPQEPRCAARTSRWGCRPLELSDSGVGTP